jgi:hypothetical protein
MDYLKRITERVNRNGEFYADGTPAPLLTIEEFFDGNEIVGSIGCNLDGEPHPSEFRKILENIRNRDDVSGVYIQVTEMDDPDWPFSDTAWIVTTADENDISGLFPDNFAPNEVWEDFFEDRIYEPIEIPDSYKVVACWWD